MITRIVAPKKIFWHEAFEHAIFGSVSRGISTHLFMPLLLYGHADIGVSDNFFVAIGGKISLRLKQNSIFPHFGVGYIFLREKFVSERLGFGVSGFFGALGVNFAIAQSMGLNFEIRSGTHDMLNRTYNLAYSKPKFSQFSFLASLSFYLFTAGDDENP